MRNTRPGASRRPVCRYDNGGTAFNSILSVKTGKGPHRHASTRIMSRVTILRRMNAGHRCMEVGHSAERRHNLARHCYLERRINRPWRKRGS